MSDDLISRKALLNNLANCESGYASVTYDEEGLSTYTLLTEIKKIIITTATAFDKEKVIEELKNPTNYTIVHGKHFTTVDRAIEIVEKGGIE